MTPVATSLCVVRRRSCSCRSRCRRTVFFSTSTTTGLLWYAPLCCISRTGKCHEFHHRTQESLLRAGKEGSSLPEAQRVHEGHPHLCCIPMHGHRERSGNHGTRRPSSLSSFLDRQRAAVPHLLQPQHRGGSPTRHLHAETGTRMGGRSGEHAQESVEQEAERRGGGQRGFQHNDSVSRPGRAVRLLAQMRVSGLYGARGAEVHLRPQSVE